LAICEIELAFALRGIWQLNNHASDLFFVCALSECII